MADVAERRSRQPEAPRPPELGAAPALSTERRLRTVGPSALRGHGARPPSVLARQLRNPLLVLLLAFHVHTTLFRSGWFVESLATESVSRPSRPLLAATFVGVGIGVALPYSPLAGLVLIELGKRWFYRPRLRRVNRRTARWSTRRRRTRAARPAGTAGGG